LKLTRLRLDWEKKDREQITNRAAVRLRIRRKTPDGRYDLKLQQRHSTFVL